MHSWHEQEQNYFFFAYIFLLVKVIVYLRATRLLHSERWIVRLKSNYATQH